MKRLPVEAPHISGADGAQVRALLLSQLQSPYLQRGVVLAFQYNDFDLVAGPAVGAGGTAGLVRLLERAVLNGADFTFVTRDPMSAGKAPHAGFADWYRGLERLHIAGADVRLHPRLHAKVYLFQSADDRCAFAVGSSNLTHQGMGFKWAECNVRGFHPAEYENVLRATQRIVADKDCKAFPVWDALLRRSTWALGLARGAEQR
jgi:hypothetical protein